MCSELHRTVQLVEALHDTEPGQLPTGLVVANDSDNSRCYMLTHQVLWTGQAIPKLHRVLYCVVQVKRLQSPCILITNHDASIMPNFQVPPAVCGGSLSGCVFHVKFCQNFVLVCVVV